MKNSNTTFLSLLLFLSAISQAGSLEDARTYERIYVGSAIKVEALPTSRTGTGFLTRIGHDDEKLVFTTAKHLIEGASELKLTVLFFDTLHASSAPVTLHVPLYEDSVKLYCQPPGEIDAVLIYIPRIEITRARLRAGVRFTKFTSMPYRFYSQMDSLFAGQPVLFPGYPLRLTVEGSKPLLRRGSIAGIDRTTKNIYLDAIASRGSSGSPVFVDLSSQANVEFFASSKQLLVGMITGFIAEKQGFAETKQQVKHLQAGIAIVLPAETIREWMDSCLANQR